MIFFPRNRHRALQGDQGGADHAAGGVKLGEATQRLRAGHAAISAALGGGQWRRRG